jgi:hypothetical protein
MRHEVTFAVGVIVLPQGVVPLIYIAPAQGNAGNGEAPAAPVNHPGTGTTTPIQSPATARSNADVRPTAADLPAARELFAETNAAGGKGAVLAIAAAPVAARALAASAGSVIERLTSTWHDGIVAAVGEAGRSSVAAHLVTAEALVVRAVDAATNLLAPLAETAASVTAAVAPPTAVVANVANVAAYNIVHMGSPFALLADSLATFVEESSSVSNVVAQAESRGPWALTASVIAADVVVLTYVYRRKSKSRRAQLAMVGVA